MVRIAKPFSFGSKGQTLERLEGKVTLAIVPTFVCFSVADWRTNSEDVIVRSSAMNEDGELFAQAGAFLSVPHIDPRDNKQLGDAIDAVIASYTRGASASDSSDDDQVIVQRMVRNVSMSGVVFTQDLSSGAPYYVINYDDESGSTDSITSGIGYANRTIYIYREAWREVESDRFHRLIEAIREIEELTEDGCLDVEFALDENLTVYILQVRRITTQPNWNRGLGLRIGDSVQRLRAKLSPSLVGENHSSVSGATVLGKMPDWNPAEMIGNAPRPLAFSLYRHMITDVAWRRARAKMGYYEPKGLPLMLSCSGQPYIDVRQSFRSYLPSELRDGLRERIVDHWVRYLGDAPQLHDKVEFSVAITTWSFDLEERAQSFLPNDLSEEEIKEVTEAFRLLTIAHLEGKLGGIDVQIESVRELQRRHRKITHSGDLVPNLQTVSCLLEDAIEMGTVPFSILARHGFIAKTLLDSLEGDVLSDADIQSFVQSVPTIASEFIDDIEAGEKGELTAEELLDKYGHLRPGTYDILSLRYDQRDSSLLGGGVASKKRVNNENEEHHEISEQKRQIISRRLRDAGFNIDANAMLEYCAKAIQGREWAKFVFTQSVSDSLELLAAWGERNGLSRDELSYLNIRDILDCLVESRGRSLEHHLRSLSEQGRRDHEVTSAIKLPYIISRPSDLVVIPMLLDQPNFITLNAVRGPCLQLSGQDINPESLDGKIVAIESADPGFDWIFTRKISGLVTKFGGANSHMAIRCAEFDLPAAIGCGEQIFERVVHSEYIELDCAVGRIEPVQH